ncbi:MAG: hypothetical protein II916_00690 [Oscillospiraceae bacterium]|nr:hypothetical protein [Oscillospiraceae bacterium]
MTSFTKLLALPAAALFLTACGDTSNLDSLIEAQNTEAQPVETLAAITEATSAPPPEVELADASNGDIDVDLTILESSMVYAQCYDMVYNSDAYTGKTIRAHGPFAYYQDPETEKEYFAVLISDATACCSQGIEFVLAGEAVFPDDYPETGTEITVTGTYNAYEENGSPYVQLLDATIES